MYKYSFIEILNDLEKIRREIFEMESKLVEICQKEKENDKNEIGRKCQ